MADAVSGETVVYQYDSLKQLISAATTGPQWGQSFGYDPFGNLLTQTVTKGSAPNMSVAVSGTTNRITTGGYSYDANGNLTEAPNLTMTYNVENRLVEATHSQNGTDQYVYDPSGRRVWKNESRLYFYSVDGTMLTSGPYYNVYFAGKLIWAEETPGGTYIPPGPAVSDRLGSVVSGMSNTRYFPYGDEPTGTAENRVKFATYYRDSITTLDYAQQRYYHKSIGRFTSPDPYRASGGPADPQSWNRYAYVQNDPVNLSDRTGLFAEFPPIDDGGSGGGPWTGPYWETGWTGEGFSSNPIFPDTVFGPYRPASSIGSAPQRLLAKKALEKGVARLEGLWKNCMDQFLSAPGFNRDDFVKKANSISWLSSEGKFGQLVIQSGGEFVTRYDYVNNPLLGNADARVVRDDAGKLTNQVVVGQHFYTSALNSDSTRMAIALHEALHVYLDLGDGDLRQWFLDHTGFRNGFGNNYGTHDMSAYIEAGCPEAASGGTSP